MQNNNLKTKYIKKIIAVLLILSMSFSLICGCSNKNSKVSKSGFYFDTIINITLYGTTDASYIDGCFDIASKYENLLSNTIDDSDISRINKNAGIEPVEVSDETIEILNAGIKYGKISNGVFDITIGNLSSLWNFSEIAENAQSDKNEVDPSFLPSEEEISEIIGHIDYSQIIIDKNTVLLKDPDSKIDLGGIAKGFIADKMKEYLINEGISSGFINLGGNVLTLGPKKDGSNYTIGIQKPFDETGNAVTTVEVDDKSVVTSGIYERYYRINGTIYHHLLDVSTGYPYDNGLYSVTIISESSMDGDALSTICFALGLDKGTELIESMDDTEAIFITDNYEVVSSSGV